MQRLERLTRSMGLRNSGCLHGRKTFQWTACLGREGRGAGGSRLGARSSLFSIPTQPSLYWTEDVRPGDLHRASWVLVLTEHLAWIHCARAQRPSSLKKESDALCWGPPCVSPCPYMWSWWSKKSVSLDKTLMLGRTEGRRGGGNRG